MSADEARVQRLAAWQVQEVVNGLRFGGWPFVAAIVYGKKRDDDGNHDGLAGASYFDAPASLMGALPIFADAARALARTIDDAHRVSGAPAWTGDSWSHAMSGSAIDAKAARGALLQTIRAEVTRRRDERASLGKLDDRVDRAVAGELAELLDYLDEVKP
jgi:hypothetical protein